MNEANKRFSHLSPAVAQERLEMTEWLMYHLDYTEEECSALSLKEMKRIVDREDES